MWLDSDQSRTLQCSTLMDPPRLALSVCHRVRTHSVAAHTSMHSISLYLGLTLVKSHFCDYLSVVTAHSLKIRRSSGSQFDSESRRNVRKKYKVLTLETKIAFGRYGYQRGGGGGGWKLMRLGGDQSRAVQRSTLVDLPPLLPALPYRSVTDCAHSVRSTAKLGLYRSNLTQTAKLGLYRSTAKLGLYTDLPQS